MARASATSRASGSAGFEQVVAGAALEALDRGGDGALAGEHDHRHLGRGLLHLLAGAARPSPPGSRKSVSTTSTETRGQQRQGLRHRCPPPPPRSRARAGSPPATRGRRPRPPPPARVRVGPAADGLTRASAARRRDRQARRGTPCRPSSRGSATTSPPCWRTMAWQIERPRPVEFLVEKKGSKMRSRSAAGCRGRGRRSRPARAPPSRLGADPHLASPGLRLAGVDDEVQRDLAEHDRVAVHHHRARSASAVSNRTRLNSGREPHEVHGLGEDAVEVQRARGARARSRRGPAPAAPPAPRARAPGARPPAAAGPPPRRRAPARRA